jgi:hypothetical protein
VSYPRLPATRAVVSQQWLVVMPQMTTDRNARVGFAVRVVAWPPVWASKPLLDVDHDQRGRLGGDHSAEDMSVNSRNLAGRLDPHYCVRLVLVSGPPARDPTPGQPHSPPVPARLTHPAPRA